MGSDRQDRTDEIYSAALPMDLTQRAAYLRQACGEDEALRAEIESLLAHEQGLGSFLEKPAVEALTTNAIDESLADHVLGPHRLPSSAALLKNRDRIENLIGSGGFAAVFLARDTELHNRPVVVKVLHERQDSREWIEKKFRQECEALSRIRHPGVVGVEDQGNMPDGRPFLVLEFINGLTLRSVIAKNLSGVDLRRAVVLLRQIAQALSAAHDVGVHHRDLKPENIMIRELGDGQEQAVIIDFGIATVLNFEASRSAATKIAGSRRSMAPEQLEGRPTAASDIYAMGVIAFEMVTGNRPFRANSAVELYLQQREGPELRPCTLRPGLPRAGAVILKALSFDAADRYARAAEFGAEFERAIAGEARLLWAGRRCCKLACWTSVCKRKSRSTNLRSWWRSYAALNPGG